MCCYGLNLASNKEPKIGDAVGIMAAQSIGEPGTQLTLRTFHIGGTASRTAADSSITIKYNGNIEIEDLKTVKSENDKKVKVEIVISRTAELRVIDEKSGVTLSTHIIPYGSNIYKKSGKVSKEDVVCDWDPYNALIISEIAGKVEFQHIEEGYTYKVESDEQTGYQEKVIIDSRDKTKNPEIIIKAKKGEQTYSIPVKAHIVVNDGETIQAGKILAKIPRVQGSSGDITGGLPRVTELFEARNPSNPAVVSEIDGIVSFGKKIKRGNKEIIVTSKTGEEKKFLVSLSKHILVQENDFVKAGTPLCDGVITPRDILAIKGPTVVQEYIVNEVQEVYRLQGVKINDKHFEVVVRQMMRKVEVVDSGDTKLLEKQLVNKIDFIEENDWIFDKNYIEEAGDSTTYQQGQLITARQLREENSRLKRKDLKLIESREAVPAISRPVLQGITRASLQTDSWISAASFQETTKVLNEAAIRAKRDGLRGLKENVIVGHKIPAGTGLIDGSDLIVGSQAEFDKLLEEKTEEVVQEEEIITEN